MGSGSQTIASDLIGHITKDQQTQWQSGSPADWAKETFALSKDDAYGQLPATNARGSFRLTDDYVTTATNDVRIQRSKAGVRLAMILNQALHKQ
ncbi:S1/P1 nuclease [Bradyrhizobium uaiense]|uniref:S1/P1 nuclease n=1 Tax=Bradyrhizobium uaiense TaxID=2594946 RepID=UPI0013EEF038